MNVWYWHVSQFNEAWSSLFGYSADDRMVFATREAAEADLNEWLDANSDMLFPGDDTFGASVESARLV